MTASSLSETLRETLSLFEKSGAPLTTIEVADRLGLDRESTCERLERLVDYDELETKTVGTNERVWWQPRLSPKPPSPDRREHDLELCRTLLDHSTDSVLIVDPDTGEYIDVNETARQRSGYSREELLSLSVPDLEVDIDDLTEWHALVDELRANGTIAFDGRHRRGDGTTYPVEVTATHVELDREYVLAVARDVTARRKRKHEFERTKRCFEAIFEDPNILVGLLEPDGTVVDINGTAMEYIEADLDEVAGDPFWETPWWGAGEEIRADVRKWIKRAAAGEYVDFEADLTRPSGEQYTLDGVFRPVMDDDGDVVSIIVSDRDVTERKQRERELQENEERLRLALEAGEMGTWELDLQTKDSPIRTPQHDRIFGYDDPLDEWDFETFLDHVQTDDRKEVKRRFEEAFETGTWDFECQITRADDEQRIISAQGEFHFDSDGEPTRAVGVVQDITERKQRERELEESERRYHTLVEHFPNGAVALVDEDFRYVTFGGTPEGDTDVTRADLEGEPLRDALPQELADVVVPRYEDALDGQASEFESTIGDRVYQFYFMPVRDDSGEIFAAMGMSQDITGQKMSERYLRDAKSQLEAATAAGAIGTWEWDVQNDEMIVGQSFARTFGVDPDAAQEGVSLDRFINAVHENDRERVVSKVEDAVETCSEYEAEYRVWNADGELRWVVARGRVECDDDGSPLTFPGALTDITKRKHAELERQRTMEQLETLVDILPIGVVVADADGSLIRANDTAKEIWGGDVFDAESIAEYDKYPAVWADTDEPVALDDWTMSQVLYGAEVTEPNVYEISAFDGEQRIIMEHGMPIRDECGDVSRAVVTLTDITERREYQRKLEESNERLEQFAYAASHDLQEPLRMVTSYLQLLEKRYGDAFDEDGEEFLAFAVDGAERMREMIGGLLEYSRVETCGDPFEPTDLNALLDDVLVDLQLQIEGKDAEVTAEDLPRVEGDAGQLRQVFQNLLSNALMYSGDEPPRVHVSAHRRRGKCVISVADDGIGINSGNQDRIFTVFDRLHSREEYDGTGIGLALCERIVERHGGEIWVDSEPGEGATFSFTLPAADAGKK